MTIHKYNRMGISRQISSILTKQIIYIRNFTTNLELLQIKECYEIKRIFCNLS